MRGAEREPASDARVRARAARRGRARARRRGRAAAARGRSKPRACKARPPPTAQRFSTRNPP
ncbi:hypothetical protein C0Z18_11535 [Trinickia dabaoshanensis]|uniref:Uncharacterized protein n=1 Tax=Trinickia dabaoshanensis TaxID=564714 RepID=A0A2N7VSB1_9BURK|nr:hypothetical protein C0Z18_11535 [Trinickia dabaoshanensis]